jgi:hypothetical protein
MIPFEDQVRRQIRAIRQFFSGTPTPMGYASYDNSTVPVQGDEVGPYVHAITRASSDGAAGSVQVRDGESQRLLTDDFGRLWVRLTANTGTTATIARSAVLAKNLVVKVTPGFLTDVRMLVTTGIAAPRWLMIFDAAAAPANGATPVWRDVMPNPGGAQAEVSDSFIQALSFSVGIVVAISTTEVTYTAPTNDEALFSAGYL